MGGWLGGNKDNIYCASRQSELSDLWTKYVVHYYGCEMSHAYHVTLFPPC